MKVLVLGGYGVFGSRLAELLLRDGHDVVIAGRNLVKAKVLADKLGCKPLVVDFHAEPGALFDASPDVVVDAAGPFHAYGHDPYIIPRLCLEQDADYLDLSDDAAFTAGLAALDDQARTSGRRLLSGVSSVPGISSAVAADLCAGLEEVLLIDTAILPGNRAPRGASVISSIVGQLGTTSRAWRGGVWRDQPCWSDARRVPLAPDLKRTARFIQVPDIHLFPGFFGARSVMFRAGMELGILNAAMRGVGIVRQRWLFDVTPRRAEFFRWIANLFLPFGTDRGGMRVAVVGRRGDEHVRREWRLVAEAGDGPYIPAVAARAIIRKLDRINPGARPCLAEATRTEMEEAMTGLNVSTATEEVPYPTLFQSALADRWSQLPTEHQILHSVQDLDSFSGTAQVTRGRSIIARVAAWIFGFPPAAEDVPVTVTKIRTEKGETWERDFGGRVFRSYLTPAPAPYRYREHFWPFNYELDIPVEQGCMRLTVRRGWFLGFPMPRFLLPKSDSREYVEDGVFRFDVALGAPLGGGLIVRYQGQLQPDHRNQPLPTPFADTGKS
jgi:NAD(P)-dependent dehydrogenase (short-subunit alcohol dehydrogenase family)